MTFPGSTKSRYVAGVRALPLRATARMVLRAGESRSRVGTSASKAQRAASMLNLNQLVVLIRVQAWLLAGTAEAGGAEEAVEAGGTETAGAKAACGTDGVTAEPFFPEGIEVRCRDIAEPAVCWWEAGCRREDSCSPVTDTAAGEVSWV